MPKFISHFFSELGFPLHSVRWSWGATAGSGVLLRTWAHDFKREQGERSVRVLRSPTDPERTDSDGLNERLRQLESIWSGGIAAYTVIATAEDPGAQRKEYKDFRDDGVFVIERIEALPDGSLVARLTDFVPVKKLPAHIQQHRTAAGHGGFPGHGAAQSLALVGAGQVGTEPSSGPDVASASTSSLESFEGGGEPAIADEFFEALVKRFAQVEVRPQQAQFRVAVFRACMGRCVVSGCDVPEALEAAHRTGRDWRAGHNGAEDGLLLRRDLHALYDSGLLLVGEDGKISLDERVRVHYGHLT